MLKNDINKSYDSAMLLERIVISDAKTYAERIINKAHAAEARAKAAAGDNAKREAQELEKNRCSQISSEYAHKLTEQEMTFRKALIAKRNEIQDSVFGAVEDGLRKFVKSGQYSEFVKKRLMSLKDGGVSADITAYISSCSDDADTVKSVFPHAETVVADDILIGGIRVCDNESSVMYDLTLDSGFEAEKLRFPELSGLKITD